MIRIAMIANSMSINGISTVIMNYCRNINLQKYNITILAGSPIDLSYSDECRKLGLSIVELPPRKTDSKKYYMKLYGEIKKGRYDIVHIHCNSATVTPELFIAWMCGVKVRIAHSHNTTCGNMKIHNMLYPLFNRLYTQGIACGEMAGQWLFRENPFHVIPNGFNTSHFSFSDIDRKRIRDKMNFQDKFIIGHIGRFNAQKNQPYLLKVFKKIAEKCKNAELLLIGTGPDFEKVKEIVEEHPYKDRIILYGETNNSAEMYSAMDVFVLPSRFEGLPVVLLEAQISGLPCVVSDKVTKEMDFGNIKWLSIEEEPEKWANTILAIEKVPDIYRKSYIEHHKAQIDEYNIEKNVKQLEKIYMDLTETSDH